MSNEMNEGAADNDRETVLDDIAPARVDMDDSLRAMVNGLGPYGFAGPRPGFAPPPGPVTDDGHTAMWASIDSGDDGWMFGVWIEIDYSEASIGRLWVSHDTVPDQGIRIPYSAAQLRSLARQASDAADRIDAAQGNRTLDARDSD